MGLASHVEHQEEPACPATIQIRWRFSLRYEVGDQWFAGPVAELVDRLMARKEFLHKVIASGGSASVIVQFLGDGYFGDNIFTDTLAKLGELGLELGLECFG
jgi:hypothetical protein